MLAAEIDRDVSHLDARCPLLLSVRDHCYLHNILQFRSMFSKVLKVRFIVLAWTMIVGNSHAEVTLLKSIKVSDAALYFDGDKVTHQGDFEFPDREKYDFYFGSRITPHGDCIEVFEDFVFMTWYKGPEAERNVMLSRYNLRTGVLATIEFEHRHTGFQNNPHIGESHNTIAVGVSPIDGTVHLLYDMHSYGPSRPADGSFKNDYFRYQVSVENAARVPDEEFDSSLFGPKRLYLKKGEDYTHLTYPFFHTNKEGELFVRIRRGGHNNGKYMLAKYDGNEWSAFWDFNILDAVEEGYPHNWGLYGDLKFENGKLRAGFETRLAVPDDAFVANNGFYYAYSEDPDGRDRWFTHDGRSVALPIVDPDPLKFYEPGDVFPDAEPNTVFMAQGPDWTVTVDDSIHFVNDIKYKGQEKNVHAYKKAGDTEFKTSTDFPGGQLYSVGSTVYLIGLEKGRPYFYAAPGGTNDWQLVYEATEGLRFKHGNVFIKSGKVYYYLMESSSGSAQPIHLLIYDLGI